MGRFLGGLFGKNVSPPNRGTSPDPGIFTKNEQYYLKQDGGWIVAGRSFKFDIVSAPGPSGDTGRQIDLETEPNNQFFFGPGSTYVLSFPRSFPANWEMLASGGKGGNGGNSSNGPPVPGGSGDTGSPSSIVTPRATLDAGAGRGGNGGSGTSFIGTPGSPGTAGIGSLTLTDPENDNFPGTINFTDGNTGAGGAGRGDAPGLGGGAAPPAYTGSFTPTGATYPGGTGGQGFPGDGMDGSGGGGGGGGGGGAYIEVLNHATDNNLNYTITSTPGAGFVRIIGNV